MVAILYAKLLPSHPASNVAESGQEDEVIVHAGADEEDQVANRLHELELLPPDDQGEDPDEDGTDTIENHPRGGAHFLGDRQAREIEEGDAHDEPNVGEAQLPVAAHLLQSVYGILEPRVNLPEANVCR